MAKHAKMHWIPVCVRKPNEKDTASLVIDSVPFGNVQYQIVNNNLIIFGGENGTMSLDICNVKEFAKEISEIAETFKN